MPRAGLDEGVVITAAIQLVDQEGLENLTLSRLAEHLGVKTPSLYKHVAGLEGVQRGLAVHAVRELGRQLARATIGKSGDAAILAMADAYRAFAKEHPGLYPGTLRAPRPGDAEHLGASEEILDIFRKVLAPYGLDEPAIIHAIRGFRSLAHGFVSLELAGGFGMPYELDESYHRLIGRFLDGLRAGT